jgi:hypothetical protein
LIFDIEIAVGTMMNLMEGSALADCCRWFPALTIRATSNGMLHFWATCGIVVLRLSLRLCCAVPLVQ